MKAAIKKHMKCSKCGKKVFDTVITRHMWQDHRPYMMANRRSYASRKNSTKQVALNFITPQAANSAREFAYKVVHEVISVRLQKQTAEQGIEAIEKLAATEFGR